MALEQHEEEGAGDGHCSAYRQRRHGGLGAKDALLDDGGCPRLEAGGDTAWRMASTGAGAAGPQLEAQRALAHQHLEASHHATVAARGPAPERRGRVAVHEVHDRGRRRDAGRAAAPPAPRPRRRPATRPTEVAFTSRSVGPGSSACATPSSAASAAARAWVRFHTATSAPASRSAHTAARPAPPAPSTSARRPATGSSSAAISPAASVLSALMRPSAKLSVLAAPMASAAGLSSSASVARRELVRDRHVRARVPGGGQRPHRLGEQLRRHRQLHVAPVEAELAERRAHHDRRAAVPDRISEHSRRALISSSWASARRASSRALLVAGDVALVLRVRGRERVLAARRTA